MRAVRGDPRDPRSGRLGIEHDAADVATVIRETAGVLAGEADWETWQRSVRGRSADERLEALGL